MPDEEREPTAEQEAAISRLLAEARATEPLPAEVAARLDRVLVGLGEERASAPAATPDQVLALAARRRRAAVLLVAAAAVVAIGVGLGQVVDGPDSGGDSGAVNGGVETSVQDEAERRQSDDSDTSGLDAGEGAPPEEMAPDGSAFDEGPSPAATSTVGRVRKSSFTSDANQLRRAIPDDAVDGQFVELSADQLPRGYVLRDRPFDCAPAPWGHGVLVPVLFDGMPAVLAYRPATGESQVVDLVQCGSGNVLGSTTLRAG